MAVSDRAGHEITFGYDPAGAPAAVRHSGGYHVQVTVAGGHVTGLALGRAEAGRADGRDGPGGREGPSGEEGPSGAGEPFIRYAYDEDGNLAGVINSSGEPLRFSYDEAGRLTGWQDRNGHFYGYTYDESGPLRARRGLRPGAVAARSATTRMPASPRGPTRPGRSPRTSSRLRPGRRDHRPAGPRDQLGARRPRAGHRLHRPAGPGYPVRLRLARQPHRRHPARRQPGARRRTTSAACRCASPIPAGDTWQQEYDARGNRTRLTAPDGAVTRFGYDEPRAPGQRHRPGGRGDPGRVRRGRPAGGGHRPGRGPHPLQRDRLRPGHPDHRAGRRDHRA